MILKSITERSKTQRRSLEIITSNNLTDLNSYFETGDISDNVLVEILSVDATIDVILENIPSTVDTQVL